MDDTYLIKGLKKRRQEFLELIMDKYSNYVFTIVNNIVRDYLSIEDIEETCGDVFLKLWENVDKIDTSYKTIKPYLATIARNTAKNRLRGNKDYNLQLEEEILIVESKVEDNLLKDELGEVLNECISTLEEPDKEIIIRYYLFYYKIREISETLNLNESTVKTKLMRSRKKLKDIMIERGYSYEDLS